MSARTDVLLWAQRIIARRRARRRTSCSRSRPTPALDVGAGGVPQDRAHGASRSASHDARRPTSSSWSRRAYAMRRERVPELPHAATTATQRMPRSIQPPPPVPRRPTPIAVATPSGAPAPRPASRRRDDRARRSLYYRKAELCAAARRSDAARCSSSRWRSQRIPASTFLRTALAEVEAEVRKESLSVLVRAVDSVGLRLSCKVPRRAADARPPEPRSPATASGTPTPSSTTTSCASAFNEFVRRENAKHADEIAAGTREPLKESTPRVHRQGVGHQARATSRTRPACSIPSGCARTSRIAPRSQLSIQAEYAVNAAQARARERRPRRRGRRSRRARRVEPAAAVSGDRDRGPGRDRRARLRLRHVARLLGGDRRDASRVAGGPDSAAAKCALVVVPELTTRPHELARARQPLHLRRRLGRARGRAGRAREARARGRSCRRG